MTAQWEARQDPRDPQAWDVWCGPTRLIRLAWGQKALAEQVCRDHNAVEELVGSAKAVLAWVDHVGAEAKRRDTEALEPLRAAIAKATA